MQIGHLLRVCRSSLLAMCNLACLHKSGMEKIVTCSHQSAWLEVLQHTGLSCVGDHSLARPKTREMLELLHKPVGGNQNQQGRHQAMQVSQRVQPSVELGNGSRQSSAVQEASQRSCKVCQRHRWWPCHAGVLLMYDCNRVAVLFFQVLLTPVAATAFLLGLVFSVHDALLRAASGWCFAGLLYIALLIGSGAKAFVRVGSFCPSVLWLPATVKVWCAIPSLPVFIQLWFTSCSRPHFPP